MASAYSSVVSIGGSSSKKYRVYLTASAAIKDDSTCTVSYTAIVQMIYAYRYGVTVSVSGGNSSSGVLTSNPGGTWTNVCSTSGSFNVSRGTSAANYTVTATGAGASVNGYGSAGGSVNVSVTVSIPAKSSYVISYNANGGIGAPSAQTKSSSSNLTLSSETPTRKGYKFLGWATSSTGSVAYQPGATYSTNASVTLYAVWAPIYYVYYIANGGTGVPETQQKVSGDSIVLSSNTPTRKGHSFLGWTTTNGSTTVTHNPGDTYSDDANITLYAVWNITDTKIYLHTSTNQCEAVEFIEDGGKMKFSSGGIVHTTELIETDDGVYIGGTKIQAVEFYER